MAMNPAERWQAVRSLRRDAPRDRFLQMGLLLFVGLCLGSWLFLDVDLRHPITGKSRFAVKPTFLDDAIPFDLRHRDEAGDWRLVWDTGLFWRWLGRTVAETGLDPFDLLPAEERPRSNALADTLALSVLAIVLAALMSLPLILPAAKNVALLEAFLPADRDVSRLERTLRRLAFAATRGLLVVMRSIPEFIWAFVFLIAFGPVALAGILALAIHNGGILGKLDSECVEDMDLRATRALSALGASKNSVALVGIGPRLMPQFLVYFFYRWETCVRETAILGVLAIRSIGFHIDHAFAQFQYDRAIVFILMNSLIVIGGDLVGTAVRRRIRGGGNLAA
ncbi:MAG: hypothetical protein H6807_15800 [Planctomycetes bacterium]|nr:hypothetical protein [Planctomycetota bacterium]